MRILERLKLLRIVRILTNLKYYRQLRANHSLYQKNGINKKVWQTLSHRSIKKSSGELPWLDGPVSHEEIRQSPAFASFSPKVQNQLLQWNDQGYILLPDFFPVQQIEEVALSVEEGLSNKDKHDYFSNRLLNLYRTNPQIKKIFTDPDLLKLLSFILGKETAPFQTINFYKSSSQPAHSDAIHLTTEPLGYSIGVWVALEDIQAGSGEFFYYPGSHRLPYILNEDFHHKNNFWILGDHLHEKYEKKVAEIIQEKALKEEIFRPKKGDLMIWHTNLLHGSAPKQNPLLTRKSMVMHYFAKGVLCYHEMLEKPAVLF
jgi:hypothetical protein